MKRLNYRMRGLRPEEPRNNFNAEMVCAIINGPALHGQAAMNYYIQTGGVWDAIADKVVNHPAELMINHPFPTLRRNRCASE